jgi:cystathionine beta-lyase family protein involved in aluminum resistance
MIREQIDEDLLALAARSEAPLAPVYRRIDETCQINSDRVLSAFLEHRVAYSDFAEINGYGNFDSGRDKLEQMFAAVLGCEDALVRPQIMSGTNALYLAFSALLKHGDTMISLTGTPYDSLQEMIGLCGDSSQSLKRAGVRYEQIELKNGDFDIAAITGRLKRHDVRLVEIQRSRGYSDRPSLTIAQIARIIAAIRAVDQEVIVFVDNCYGELVETREPGHVGADIVVGSLMKNLGGGIASSGGYIAGRQDLIAMCADRLTAPGLGKQQGANFNQNNSYFKGLFMAPEAVASSLKTAVFAAWMLKETGYQGVSPAWDDYRTDTIQRVVLGSREKLVAFAQGLQAASPIDSDVTVEPAPMPGYPFDEVASCGSFTQGSTIELSADAPMVEPYALYLQGGLTPAYGRLGILLALTRMRKEKSR